MNYIDTSVLVAALTKEAAHSPRADSWLMSHGGTDLAISEWTIAEFSSALSVKLRVGSINSEQRRAVLEAFSTMASESLLLLPVTSIHFRSAARLADRHRQGLRAGDALHLAVASEQDATLCTLDKRMASAAKALGVAAKLV